MRFYLLPVLFLAATAQAQLKWDKPTQRFERSPEDKLVEGHYSFRNTGTVPVTIKSIHSNCGCTTARLEKKTYAPGEGSEVVVTFKFGDRKGLYGNVVTVKTDVGEPAVLDLIVNIRDPLTIAPALVWWRRGEASDAKSALLAAQPGESVRVTSVSSSNPRFSASLITNQPGQKYAIAVTPTDTTQKDTAEIKVQTDYPNAAPRAYTIYARIK